jgi:putative transposase
MAGFIETMRAEGYAAWSICRVLREQGCQVAAQTYRSRATARSGSKDDPDAHVIDTVRSAVWTADTHGRRKMTPSRTLWSAENDRFAAPDYGS